MNCPYERVIDGKRSYGQRVAGIAPRARASRSRSRSRERSRSRSRERPIPWRWYDVDAWGGAHLLELSSDPRSACREELCGLHGDNEMRWDQQWQQEKALLEDAPTPLLFEDPLAPRQLLLPEHARSFTVARPPPDLPKWERGRQLPEGPIRRGEGAESQQLTELISGKDGRGPSTIAGLGELLQLHSSALDAMHDAAACARIAVLVRGGERGEGQAQALCAERAQSWLSRPQLENGRAGRGAANILYAVARVRIKDSALVLSLAREAARLSPQFDAQGAANALWACAKLGVTNADVVRSLCGACVSVARSMNAQNAANALWACAVLSIYDAAVLEPFAAAAERVFASRSPSIDDTRQLAQAHLALSSCLPSGALLSPALLERCYTTLETAPRDRTISQGQQDVAASLSRLGHTPRMEVSVLRGLHSVDVLCEGGPLPLGVRVAVEFDGPSHFVRGGGGDGGVPLPTGETRLRDKLLRGGGFVVVAVPYHEWGALRGEGERDGYLRARLGGAVETRIRGA